MPPHSARSTTRLTTRRELLALAAGGGLIAGTVVAAGLPGEAAARQPSGEPLVGSWYSSVERPTGLLVTLTTFSGDGTMIQATVDHPTRSPAHGSWERLGDRSYGYTTLRLMFDPDGSFVGFQKSRVDVTVSETGNNLATEAQVDIYDASGQYDRSSSSTGSAIRIHVEPRSAPPQPAIPLGTTG